MRAYIAKNLIGHLEQRMHGLERNLEVLVIGGDENDPEVESLKRRFPLNLTFAGIELVNKKNYFGLDLNDENANLPEDPYFDVIMCNQVFEHIYDFRSALINLARLAKPHTLIWIDFPTSTFEHGSPNFYFSGIMPECIMKLGTKASLDTLEFGAIGSERNFLYGHLLNVWPTKWQELHPVWSYFGVEGSLMKKLRYQIKTLPSRILLLAASNFPTNERRFSTTGWIILSKPGFSKPDRL